MRGRGSLGPFRRSASNAFSGTSYPRETVSVQPELIRGLMDSVTHVEPDSPEHFVFFTSFLRPLDREMSRFKENRMQPLNERRDEGNARQNP